MNTVEQYAEEKQRLVDAVLKEIKVDVSNGADSAIKDLIMFLPVDKLKGYLPEEQLKNINWQTICN
jgi:hypothetical protein|tara:strand:- start:7 stop:204 length:198 start_codon:yes stop_codon:yes gene_type:complete